MFSPHCTHAMQQHALRDYPNEAIGMVVDGDYLELENVARDKLNSCEWDDRVPLRYGRSLNALVHSHPATPDYQNPNIPSPEDQRAQLAWGCPFGIVVCNGDTAAAPFWWGDGVPKRHWTEPRGFHWIVADCYEFIRDIYWQQLQIRLRNFVREWGEWRESPGKPARSGYLENFAAGGFVEVDRPRPFDLALLKFTDMRVPSHAGVLLDGNLWAHHLADDDEPVNPHRLSTVEPLGRWTKYTDPRRGGRWLRYVGEPK